MSPTSIRRPCATLSVLVILSIRVTQPPSCAGLTPLREESAGSMRSLPTAISVAPLYRRFRKRHTPSKPGGTGNQEQRQEPRLLKAETSLARQSSELGSPENPLYQRLGVYYLPTEPDARLPEPLRRVFAEPAGAVWELPGPFPRIFSCRPRGPCASRPLKRTTPRLGTGGTSRRLIAPNPGENLLGHTTPDTTPDTTPATGTDRQCLRANSICPGESSIRPRGC